MELKEKILDVVRGPHVAAVATGTDGGPAVRNMVLAGFDDMTFVGATGRATNKVAQLRKDPNAAIAIWSLKEFTDPYVQFRAMGEVREDRETKVKYWNPMWEQYFQSVDNPEFVVLVFRADEIEYYDPKTGMVPEVWRRP